jgi:hypothetical protein
MSMRHARVSLLLSVGSLCPVAGAQQYQVTEYIEWFEPSVVGPSGHIAGVYWPPFQSPRGAIRAPGAPLQTMPVMFTHLDIVNADGLAAGLFDVNGERILLKRHANGLIESVMTMDSFTQIFYLAADGSMAASFDGPSNFRRGFLISASGQLTDIGSLRSDNGWATIPTRANAQGWLTGYSTSDMMNTAISGGFAWHAFRYRPGEPIHDLGHLSTSNHFAHDINDRGDVVGIYFVPGERFYGFLYTDGGGIRRLSELSNCRGIEVHQINNAGMIAGLWSDEELRTPYRLFTWTEASGMVDRGVIPGLVLEDVLDLNERGELVGRATNAEFHFHAFIHAPTLGLRDLNSLIPPHPQVLREPVHIDEQGRIVSKAYPFGGLPPFSMVMVTPVGGECYANCDGSSVIPALNVGDFTCFLQRFAAGEAYANCDQSTTAPMLNVGDFTCFLQRLAAGCP